MSDIEFKAKFIAFLDQARWSNGDNYYDINYSHEYKQPKEELPADEILSADDILLTHWLCYISDRQMDFMQIWDVGGFVYSDIVFEYSKKGKKIKDLLDSENGNSFSAQNSHSEQVMKDLLNPENGDSFFVPNPYSKKVMNDENGNTIRDENGNPIKETAYMFLSHQKPNKKIEKWYSRFIYPNPDTNDNKVKFTSRYYPSDYISIYYTLYILQYFKYSFTEYIAQIINKAFLCCIDKDENKKAQTIMECLFCGLYVLSYSNIGQPEIAFLKYFPDDAPPSPPEGEIDNEEIKTHHSYSKYIQYDYTPKKEETIKRNILWNLPRDPKVRKDIIKEWLKGDNDTFLMQSEIVYQKFRYSSKRVWCCIRDYLKHTYDKNEGNKKKGFNDLFKNALNNALKNSSQDFKLTFDSVFPPEILHLLELPGDIWNNNSTFRKCLFLEKVEKKPDEPPKNEKSKSLNMILRELYDEQENKSFYPEQFDITFNFVPRMCEQGKCEYCPIRPERCTDDKINAIFQNNFKMLCHDKKGDSLCPAVLMYTGYIHKCQGRNECALYNLISPPKA